MKIHGARFSSLEPQNPRILESFFLKNMFPYYFIRFSGPVLFILLGFKVLSGYALVGKISAVPWLSSLHQDPILDVSLLTLFIFHALYGLRLFLIDLGLMRQESLLFWASTIVSAGLLAFSYFYFF